MFLLYEKIWGTGTKRIESMQWKSVENILAVEFKYAKMNWKSLLTAKNTVLLWPSEVVSEKA